MKFAALLLALAARDGIPLDPAQGKEERGKFKLAFFGKEAGHEEFRLEELEGGTVVLFSKSSFDVEVGGRRQSFLIDTVLTLDSRYAPVRYAGYHKLGADERTTKVEWKKGVAVSGTKEARTAAPWVLDNNVYAQLQLILRRYEGGRRKVKFFSPAAFSDQELLIDEKGEVTLGGAGRTVRAREYQLAVGAVGLTAYLDEKKRLVRAVNPVMGGTVELEGFEGLAPDRPRAEVKLPEGVEEADVSFVSGAITLSGSVTKPHGGVKLPAVVLISGSGPQDRDLNVVPGRGGAAANGPTFPDLHAFKSVAYALSAAGVLVLRYDDRGCGKSRGDFGTAKLSDLAADAGAAAAYLRSRPDVASVGLVGHSEGGVIAPIVAARDPRIRAIFLMAGPGKPLDEIIMEQAERQLRGQGLDGERVQAMLSRQRRVLEEIKRSESDYLDVDERRTFIGWMREHFNHDVPGEVRKVKGKVVVLQGMRDAQVLAENADLLLQARPDAEVKRFEELDHLFMKSEGKVGEYADPDRRVDSEFLRFLADRVVKYLR